MRRKMCSSSRHNGIRSEGKTTVDLISKVMENRENVRNISVIAHVDHGKTTLTDSMLGRCGLISKEKIGTQCQTDNLQEEKDRGITIKSTSVSLVYEWEKESYLVNLIDCPGHVDFSSEVTSALRVTDGALVVVDCVEGVCIQTETVLNQAVDEKIIPILFLNKMDRIFDHDNENIYQTFKCTIDNVNGLLQTFCNSHCDSNSLLSPSNGKVGFGSGLQGWGFTLDLFSKMYSCKFSIDSKKLMGKLWGDNYWDCNEKKWRKKGLSEERGFNMFVLNPLRKLIKCEMDENELLFLSKCLGIYDVVTSEFKKHKNNNNNKSLLPKLILKSWLSAGDTLFEMICQHLPNPCQAQSYRMNHLYTGPKDCKEFEYLMKCSNENSSDDESYPCPMFFYTSKMVPTSDFSRFIAFGRVFSGKVRAGDEVVILDGEFKKKVKIQKVYIMMGCKREIVSSVCSGCVCGLEGLDKDVLNTCTLVSCESFQCGLNFFALKKLNFNVSPIVEVAVNVVKEKDLKKLTDGLIKLKKFDNLVEIRKSDLGENIIAASGELHLQSCLNTLENVFLNKETCPIEKSDPIVSYCETISLNSNNANICLSKSKNKHNRIKMSCHAISNELFLKNLEENSLYYLDKVRNRDGLKALQLYLNENKFFDDESDCLKIWSFGATPGDSSFCNILVDESRGVQLLNEIKNDVVSGFKDATERGVLCREPLRGVKFSILDAKIHSDRAHRGSDQICNMTRKVCHACCIANEARLMEPIYFAEIVVNNEHVNAVYNVLSQRKGKIIDCQLLKTGNRMNKLSAHIAVSNCFGFDSILKSSTQGTAFATLKFSHWNIINGDPYKDEKIENIIFNIRERKGMKKALPQLNDYHDKI